jgi:undecaprenyl-phosphate 4-deoxy-4-formamido-L-arabinose transferase
VRQARQDRFDRRAASALFSRLARALRLRHRISDPGCMLRAWRRSVVEQFLASGQAPAYLPIQLNRFAASYEELEVQHAPRHAGRSRYSAWSLARLLTRALVSATFPRVLARREPEVACVLDDEASR